MDLKDIASVSGKSGLFKVVKPTRTGVILETVDEQKNKIVANANNRVSLLKEISVYTTGKESSQPLEKIFENIYSIFGNKIDVDSKSSPQELSNFLEKVVPDFDKEKVYLSDIKKIVSWYITITQHFPERFVEQEKTEDTNRPENTVVETVAESQDAPVKKAKATRKSPATKKTE
jgi:hypothetical protein